MSSSFWPPENGWLVEQRADGLWDVMFGDEVIAIAEESLENAEYLVRSQGRADQIEFEVRYDDGRVEFHRM